jgi:hypothetical protein
MDMSFQAYPTFPVFLKAELPAQAFKTMRKQIPLEEGDYYWTPEGYRVFTAKYLLKRGYCCESGCRHCPYGFNPRTQRREK